MRSLQNAWHLNAATGACLSGNGPDGAPRIFALSALQAMGNNYGKKQADWGPTVQPTHPNCVPPGTMVTTLLGPRSIEHVYPGDYVWTHKQRLRRVTHVWCQHYQGEMVHISCDWGHVRATPNHPVYDGAEWRLAGEVAKGDVMMRDSTMPQLAKDPHAGARLEDYAQMLFGQGPDSPFVALITCDGVFMHEGFIYHKERLSDGLACLL